MDHLKILKRAYHLTLNYRALWVFGILLALTTPSRRGGDGGGGGGGSGGSSFLPANPLPGLRFPEISAQAIQSLWAIGLMLACLGIVLVGAFVILRYLSETALIRMVDLHETTGERVGVRQGFRLGWSRPAFRIFLIDLLFGLGGMILFLLLLAVAAAPLLLWLIDSEALQVIGTVTSIGLGILVILLAILAFVVLSLLLQFFRRACILEGLGVLDSIRRGYAVFRLRLGDGVVMGILLFALGLAFVIVLIPIAIMLILAAVVLGGGPALLVGWIVNQFVTGTIPWIAGAAVGAPIFLFVVIAPLLFLSGLMETFKSSTWTLTYREFLAIEGALAETPPAPDLPVMEGPEAESIE
jgi:hypothetical protein